MIVPDEMPSYIMSLFSGKGRIQEDTDLAERGIEDAALDICEVVPVREGNEEKPYFDSGGMDKV